MLIERKDHTLTCPAQNWERIPIITCTGTKTSQPCQHFGADGTQILCHHAPPGAKTVDPKPQSLYPRWSARIGVRLSENELDRIDLFVDITNTDRSNVIRTALKEYLDDQPLLKQQRPKK